ncbi:ankyrin [Annulohypoxylon maeteangense]|uniref:ankyrin n=1 Tax=Annulohypoxylon maeteangense TaxID=1927788 RepID=UPI002008E723|nr:ankyrin [Annulohypoxylon maeteangense]KAI0888316.1 ankyrin [Annulohypoxylon maeteangense]
MERSGRLELSLKSEEPILGGGRLLTAPSSEWYQYPYQKDDPNDPERYITFHEINEAAEKHNVPSIPIDDLGVQLGDSSSREMFALGSGSTSQVIQHVTGEDTKHIVPPNTTVAVKFFRAQNENDDVTQDSEVKREVYKAILSEIHTAFRTSLRGHPNLAQPLFVGWLKGNQFPVLAMQLGDHGSLDLIIRTANSSLSATEKRHITFDVALGLQAIHRAGLAHGDLKPDNILVMTHNDPSRQLIAKLSDFGGSFQLTGQQLSRPAHITPMWCAPEVINHDPGIDWQKADVYSLGLVMGSLWAADYGKLMQKLGRRSSCFLSRPNQEDEEEDWLWAVKSSPNGCVDVLKQALEYTFLDGFPLEKADNAELLEILTPTLHRYFWRRPNTGDLLKSLRDFEGETGRNILEEDEVAANGHLTGKDVTADTKSKHTREDDLKFREITFEQCSFATEDFGSLLNHWDSSQDTDIPPRALSHDELFDNLRRAMMRLTPPKFFQSPGCLARPGAQARLARLSWELAMCHYFGKGTSSNLDIALRWMRISALCGSRKAMHITSLMATETTTQSRFPIRLCLSLLALSGSDLALERLSIDWPDLFKIIREIIRERYLAYQMVKEQQGDAIYLHTLEPYRNLSHPSGSLVTIQQAMETGAIDEIEQILDGSLMVEDLNRLLPDLLHWLVYLTDAEASALATPAFERGARLDALRKCESPFIGAKPVMDTVYSPISSAIIHGKPQLALAIFCLHIESDTPIIDFPTALFLSFRYLQPQVGEILLGLLQSNPSMCRNDTMPWIFKEAHLHSLRSLAISWIHKEAPLNELLTYTMYDDDLTELERRAINGSDFDDRYKSCLKVLLESGADPTEGISIKNPLYNAIIHDDLVSLQLFIRHIQSHQSPNFSLLDHLQHTKKLGSENIENPALLCCIAFNSIRCFEFLIKEFPTLMFSSVDDHGHTPLRYACSHPQGASFVKLLLENGADTTAVDLSLGVYSVLFAALADGYLETANLIADRCSAQDLDQWMSINDDGTSMFVYILFRSRDIKSTGGVQWFIDRGGAHFYGPDYIPVWYTLFAEPRPTRQSDRAHTELLRVLLSHEMFSDKLNTERRGGMALIHFLVKNGYVEAVRLLLEWKADINVEMTIGDDTQRITALDLAYISLRGEEYPPGVMAGGRFEMERWVEDIHLIIRLLRAAGGKNALMGDQQTQLLESIQSKMSTGELNTHNLMFTKHREYRGHWPRPLPSGESSDPVQKFIETQLAKTGIAKDQLDLFVDNYEHDLQEAKRLSLIERTGIKQDNSKSSNDPSKRAPMLHKTWRLPPGWGFVAALGLIHMEFYVNLETGEMSDQKPELYCGEHDERSPYDRKGKGKATATSNDRGDELPMILIVALPPDSPLVPIFREVTGQSESVTDDRPFNKNGYSAFGLCNSADTVKDFNRTFNGMTLARMVIHKVMTRASVECDIVPGSRSFIDLTRDIARKSWDGLPPRAEVLIGEILEDAFAGKNSIDKVKDFVKATGMVDKEDYLGSTPYQLVNLGRPLHDAIFRDDMEAFGKAIEKVVEKGELESENWEGQTPLELAIFLDHVDMASILLAHGAKIPDKLILTTGLPALHYTAIRGNMEMTKLLLDSGIDPNSPSPEGTVPLQLCFGFNPEMALLLMENGADFELAHRIYLLSEMTKLHEDSWENVTEPMSEADPNGNDTEKDPITYDEARQSDAGASSAILDSRTAEDDRDMLAHEPRNNMIAT